VIFGETVTGTFRNLGVAPRTEPDGSGVVEIVMGDPDFQLTAFTNLGTPKENEVIYLYGVPKDLTPGIIAVYKALGVKGSAVTTNYYRDQHLVDLIFRQRVPGKKVEVTGIITGWNCRYKSTEDQHYGLTEAEADALVLTEPPDGEDWKSDKRFNQEDGTWTVFIEKKQTQYRDVPFQVSRIAADSTEQTRQQLGLTTQTAEPMTSVDGEVKTQRVAVRDDCSNDVTTNKDKVTNVQKVSYEKNALVNAEITDNSAAAAVLPDETPAAGTRVSISNVKTEYPAKTKTRRTVETVEDLDKKSYDHNGFIKTTITEHPAAVADEAEPAPAVGEAIQVVNDPTPFKDRTKTKKATEVAQAIDIAEHAIHFGEKETIYETEGIHDHTQPVITDPGDHSSLTLIANLDKYLTWNWRKRRSVRTFPVDDGVGWNEYGDLEAVSLQEMSMFLSPNRNYVSKVYIYQVVYIHTINYYDNASDAAGHAFIAGTTVLPNDPNANGFSSGLKTQYEDNSRSRIYHSGENEWQAHRITITKSLRYTYCYDEPVE